MKIIYELPNKIITDKNKHVPIIRFFNYLYDKIGQEFIFDLDYLNCLDENEYKLTWLGVRKYFYQKYPKQVRDYQIQILVNKFKNETKNNKRIHSH